ncbi:hypothetical protein HW49_01695 [Porphyromonadaceae bacterium COT-184 OH4590]|nr:hypothetical protein HW49_01695 [Porphyromonadaceae bacterium COT-184 OH4590]
MKKVFNFIWFCLLATIVVFGFNACKEPSNNVVVTGVYVDPTEKTIAVGESFTITANVTPENAKNKSVKWASSASDIVKVDENGKVEALKVGTAAITATTVEGSKTASCKVTVTEQTVDASKVDVFYFYYLSNADLPEGHNMYALSLVIPGTRDERGLAIKKGVEYRLALSSGTPDNQLKPTVGEYNLSAADDDFSQMTVCRQSNLSMVRIFDEQDITVEVRSFKEGKFIVEANKLTFKGKDSKGEECNLVFEGDYKVSDISEPNPWKYEPTVATSKTENFTQAIFTDYKNEYFDNGNRYIYVSMRNEERPQEIIRGGLGFVLDKNVTQIPEGVYNVSDSKQPNTLWKSIGTIKGIIKGCALIYQKALHEVYYISSGTAIVTAGEIKFTGKSHFGSDITINFKGDMPDMWKYEPRTPTTKTESFTEGVFRNFQDFFNNNTKTIYAYMHKNDQKIQSVLAFIINKYATELPAGSYNVSDAHTEGTLWKSEGLNDQNIITGCLLYYTEAPQEIYYIVSGNAVVAEDEIKFNGQSHFGSTINLNYKGAMVIVEKSQNAPAQLVKRK